MTLQNKPTKLVREILRNYLQFEDLCAQTGHFEIEYGGTTISFSDLKGCLAYLTPLQKDAVYHSLICDQMQMECSKRMNMSSQKIGQEVSAACAVVAERLFPEVAHG